MHSSKWTTAIDALSITTLSQHATRASMAVIAISTSVAVTILLAAVLTGTERSVKNEISLARGNLIRIHPLTPADRRLCRIERSACPRVMSLRAQVREAQSLASLSSVKAVTTRTTVWLGINSRFAKLNSVRIEGVTADWIVVEGANVLAGTNLEDARSANGDRVALINGVLAARLFGEVEPLGQRVRIGSGDFIVVGVFGERPSIIPEPEAPKAIVGLTALFAQIAPPGELVYLVLPQDYSSTTLTEDEVVSSLRAQRGLEPRQQNTFSVISNVELLRIVRRLRRILLGMISVLLPVGLVSGAMTIAAVMIVSVGERTVEIGIRRASGATVRTIWRQFLLESAGIAAIGAAIGTVVGLVGIILGKTFMPIPLGISSLPFVLGILGPMCAGLVGGLYPAIVASRIKVIDALHYE